MPKFTYIAKDASGKEERGEMEGAERREVAEALRREGKWVTSLEEVKQKSSVMSAGGSSFLTVPLKNKMMFCRHLGVMIASGLSLSRALGILGAQEKNPQFRSVIQKLTNDVKEGIGLGDSMAKHPAVFNSVFVSMVKVGEVSGNLEDILNILANQLEKDHKLISKVRGALIYPAIVMSVMIVIAILMMIFVVPKITAIFKDFNATLPPLTRLVISTSNFMAAHSGLVLGGLVGSVVLIRLFAKTEPGKKIFHKMFLHMPVVGEIVVKVNSARFARILSSLLNSGVSLVEALSITSSTLGNYYYKNAVNKAAEDVQRGISLSQVLYGYKGIFPYLVIQMVEVGEETGKTPDVLMKLAGFYEEEVDQVTKNMSSIIEPVMMVIIGGGVGFFAIAIIQPIYSIMNKV